MKHKIKVGDIVRIKEFSYFATTGKNPYKGLAEQPGVRLELAAGTLATVCEIHPAGFAKLRLDGTNVPDVGLYLFDMIELVHSADQIPPPVSVQKQKSPFPLEQAAISIIQGLLCNERVAGLSLDSRTKQGQGNMKTLAQTAVALAKALEAEFE